MLKIKPSTKYWLFGTVVAGTMFANSMIKTEKEKIMETANIENKDYNPFRSPATMGTVFVLGLLSTFASKGKKDKE